MAMLEGEEGDEVVDESRVMDSSCCYFILGLEGLEPTLNKRRIEAMAMMVDIAACQNSH